MLALLCHPTVCLLIFMFLLSFSMLITLAPLGVQALPVEVLIPFRCPDESPTFFFPLALRLGIGLSCLFSPSAASSAPWPEPSRWLLHIWTTTFILLLLVCEPLWGSLLCAFTVVHTAGLAWKPTASLTTGGNPSNLNVLRCPQWQVADVHGWLPQRPQLVMKRAQLVKV
jgi:hypothetical protein